MKKLKLPGGGSLETHESEVMERRKSVADGSRKVFIDLGEKGVGVHRHCRNFNVVIDTVNGKDPIAALTMTGEGLEGLYVGYDSERLRALAANLSAAAQILAEIEEGKRTIGGEE